MFRSVSLLAAAGIFGLLATSAAAAPDPKYVKEVESDAPGAVDHALTGRYKGSFILGQTATAFDEIVLPTGPAAEPHYSPKKHFTKTVTLRGKVTRSIYVAPTGRSALEVFTNYRDALKKAGFKAVFTCSKAECGASFTRLKYVWSDKTHHPVQAGYAPKRKLLIKAAFSDLQDIHYTLMKKSGPSGDTHVALYAGVHNGGSHGVSSEVLRGRPGVLLEIVEPKAMESRMVVLDAKEISGGIAATGKAVFYGIQFDFDKADIKPESEPQLAEMAKALKAEPKLKVFIVGHTDAKGKLDYNIGLSQRRAEAVVEALKGKYGIAAGRLTPKGLGPYAPVASNRSEDGQAQNRRVEMVER